MDYNETLKTVRENISLVMEGNIPAEINPEWELNQPPLSLDSLDVVDMVMRIEDAFDIQIADEDAEDMLTVHDIVAHLVDRIG